MGSSDADVVQAAGEADGDAGVVVLSQYDEPAHAIGLLQDGVAGRTYLLKERVAQPGQLAEAVRAVAAGGSVIDPRIVESMLTARTRPDRSRLRELTTRECEVLAEMATGANNATIAELHGVLAPHRMLSELGVQDRAQLRVTAFEADSQPSYRPG